MRRVLAILATVSFLFIGAGVALVVDVARNGAINERPVGTAPSDTFVALVSDIALLGLIVLLAAAALGLVLAARQRAWVWFATLLILTPLGIYAYLQAGFTADVRAAFAALVAPLVCLLYALRARPSASEARRQDMASA
jgi:hypothetical protein